MENRIALPDHFTYKKLLRYSKLFLRIVKWLC